ncbi:MAG: glycerophosphodiester phosphodiesterase family protein [Aestuariivirga sp.]|nr:glycerophosphodiester phosphodiesterase family protein [Aestuariivirga sp.]
MRFTPQLRAFEWLVARPIAHRGLHTKSKGIIENTAGAFEAAIKGNYAIECDVQLTADGEAIVFHDDDLERLTESKGPVKALTTKALQKVKLKATSDCMQTLAELLEQVDGRATLVIELKSLWDGNDALASRALQVLENYDGPYCLMSFDPDVVACLRGLSPETVRGIVADRTTDPYYNILPMAKRYAMRNFAHLAETQPHFVSYNWRELPFEPVTEIRNAGHPVITWTLRSKEEASQALRYCDQITFEGYTP